VISFVFVQHFWSACEAALLFFLGALLAWPLLKIAPRFLAWFSRLLFRLLRRLFGEDPTIARMAGVIFGFNGSAMFLYMATGFRPWMPEAVAVLTGFNISVVLLAADGEIEFFGKGTETRAGWVPGKRLTGLCGMMVLLLELPCFWYTVGMGVSLGREILSGGITYTQGLLPRAQAYALVILPLLLVSAVCEAVAIRGMRNEL